MKIFLLSETPRRPTRPDLRPDNDIFVNSILKKKNIQQFMALHDHFLGEIANGVAWAN